MKVTLTLTVEEVSIIIAGLGELPAKTSMLLIQKIQEDANKQISNPNVVQQDNTIPKINN